MRRFMQVAAAVVIVVATYLAAARAVPAGDGHERDFGVAVKQKDSPQVRQEGEEVVVTQTVTVNNSRHAVVTDAFRDERTGEMRLTYVVIQNKDYLVRSQKRIEVTWRVGKAKATDPVRVNGSVLHLGTAELKAFAGELAGVVEGPVGEGK